jgi:hypothetical protein
MAGHYRSGWIAIVLAVLTLAAEGGAAGTFNKYLTGTRPAKIILTSRSDLALIDGVGGIIDRVVADTAVAYITPEAGASLQEQGLTVIWQPVERPRPDVLDNYHTNDQIETQFATWQTTYPDLFSYESIGQSVNGRNIWACKISDNVTADEAEPEVKYIGELHGNEALGTENCLRFAEDLLANYGTDTVGTDLVDNFEIWLVPMANPDGVALLQRGNAHDVDLNRDFPDRLNDSVNTPARREAETGVLMNWSAHHNFILSANFHTGVVVTNFPWDGNASGLNVYTASPEDSLFRYIALQYSRWNTRMFNSTSFPQGITNGADWYVIHGGMQDWNYVWMGDREVTIELDEGQPPAQTALDSLWQENRTSMRKYLLEARNGVHGLVTDSATGAPIHAGIRLGTIVYLTYSTALHGDYYRMLRPGTYSMTFTSPGYVSKTVNNIVVAAGTPTQLDVQLQSLPRAMVSAIPAAINTVVDPCDQREVPLTIVNSGDEDLTWSAAEGDTSFGGYGSATGGGWRFIDSNQSGGPTYGWKDISTAGTQVSFTSDDQNRGPYDIGFSFPSYGQNYTTYRVSANGWISFTSTIATAASYNNGVLPDTSAPENLIAPWWDDLSPQRVGSNVRRWTNSTDSLVVSYQNVQSRTGGGLYNFEVILLSSGKMVFQYGNMGTNRLTLATIGLQNSDRTKGATVIVDRAYIQNNLAIAWCPSSMIELDPATGSVPAHGSLAVTARVKSCCVPDSISYGFLEIASNDVVTPILRVPVRVNVTSEPPAAVDNLIAAWEEGGCRLSWRPAPAASSYRVYRMINATMSYLDGTLLTPEAISDTTFVDAHPATPSFYQVISVR